MKKQTVIDQIEVRADSIGVRFAKQIIDDDGTVVLSEWHRTTFENGSDIDAQMAMVNAHLAAMKYPTVDVEEISAIKDHRDLLQQHLDARRTFRKSHSAQP